MTQLPERSDLNYYGKLMQYGTPIAGQVEVQSGCFQHCRMCESWRDDLKGVVRGTWSVNDLLSLTQRLASFRTFEHLSLTGGDPQAWKPLTQYLAAVLARQELGTLRKGFGLQLNTALTRDVEDVSLWSAALQDVRVSLDAIDKDAYAWIRGDKDTDPLDVVARVDALGRAGVNVQLNVCVTAETLDQMEQIAHVVASAMDYPPRKVTFLPVIGDRFTRDSDFWIRYSGETNRLAVYLARHGVKSNDAEGVAATREWCSGSEAAETPCYHGGTTFHIKANGDVYPCCLVGGEAISTYKQFILGNYFEGYTFTPTRKPQLDYADEDKPCRNICQWKQAALNKAAHEASLVQLSMP